MRYSVGWMSFLSVAQKRNPTIPAKGSNNQS